MKTILVVDIGNDEYLLNKKINAICFEDGDKIYDNFNFLKPMPQKVEMDMNEYYEGVADGWNNCIDTIVGETE